MTRTARVIAMSAAMAGLDPAMQVSLCGDSPMRDCRVAPLPQ